MTAKASGSSSSRLILKGKSAMRRVVPPNARGSARRWILATPGLSHLYYAIDPVARTMRLRRDTEIMIDGFPRSANTFAVESFLAANPGHSVAHHLHDRHRVRRAIARGIPVVLIVRNPDGCVNSFLNAGFEPSKADYLYGEYTTFYRDLLDRLSDVTIAEFSEITTSWPDVIRRFNKRFATTYTAMANSDDEIMKRVEDFGKSHAFGQATFDAEKFEKVVSRPSRSRTDFNLEEAATQHVRQAALDVYRAVMAVREADA